MKAFTYERAETVAQAAKASAEPGVKLLAGGTNLLDLMKLQIEAPTHVIDINRLPLKAIDLAGEGLRIGALATNTAVASHPVVRERYPVLAKALLAGASAQLRNKATVSGNLLQRTRCSYFYDPSKPCNKRNPGTGCSAIGGFTRMSAILGASEDCIATHPSDMAVALTALDAVVETTDGEGAIKTRPIGELHRLPGSTPHIETTLAPGELITAIQLPAPPAGPQTYRKVRDRASFAFALVSLAAAGDRFAIGGVAHKPWRATAAEDARREGASPDDAAAAELAQAKAQADNGFKITLARRLLAKAMAEAGV
jgi:xanthine dehydrogenase YagS FAD-binding subunit